MMKLLVCTALALCLIVSVVAAGNDNKQQEEDNRPPIPGYEEYQILSARYRASIVRAVGRYLTSNYSLGNLKGPDGRRKFDSAWAKLKALCNLVSKVNADGITPKHLDSAVWEQLVKTVQYILSSRMLLPDEVFNALTGRKISG